MDAGRERMQELERQIATLRDTMLRISGAIQVLEELQAEAASATPVVDNGNRAHERAEGAAESLAFGV
jgi:hypothetical protein